MWSDGSEKKVNHMDGRWMERHTWIESISTENTRAPSFANKAARGLPTTSDLFHKTTITISKNVRGHENEFDRQYQDWETFCPSWRRETVIGSSPVDHSNGLSVCTIAVWQDLVINTGVF